MLRRYELGIPGFNDQMGTVLFKNSIAEVDDDDPLAMKTIERIQILGDVPIKEISRIPEKKQVEIKEKTKAETVYINQSNAEERSGDAPENDRFHAPVAKASGVRNSRRGRPKK